MRRTTFRALLAALLALPVALCAARPALAQVSREDSAAVLLDAARRLNGEGQRAAADAVLDLLRRSFPGTPAAASADSLLGGQTSMPEREGGGRTQLIAWSTLYGAWLGLAVPAMLGADGPEPYGVGLLLGGPAGFVASKAWADRHAPTSGQSAAMMFGFRFGLWQGLGWRDVFEIGNHPSCSGCTDSDPGRSPWTAMVLGGGAGFAAGAVIGARRPPEGVVAMASHGAYWGTWLGIVGATLADQHDDNTMATVLLASDAGLVIGALAAPRDVTSGRVWATSALGIAGTAAGFGIDLITQPSGDKAILAIPAATGLVALAYGWHATRDMDHRRSAADAPGLELGVAPPVPAPIPAGLDANGRRIYRAGLRIPLLTATF